MALPQAKELLDVREVVERPPKQMLDRRMLKLREGLERGEAEKSQDLV